MAAPHGAAIGPSPDRGRFTRWSRDSTGRLRYMLIPKWLPSELPWSFRTPCATKREAPQSLSILADPAVTPRESSGSLN